MTKTYEVTNRASGHSFGYYPGASADEAIAACCHEAGYESWARAQSATECPLGNLRADRVAVIDAAPYADEDDCLLAAAEAYAAKHDLAGWDLSPRWQDGQRDTIILTVPEHV